MEKSQKSHIIQFSLIAILFSITPFLRPSMRPPYLYFLLNLLLIAIGADAGLLSFLKPRDDKKPTLFAPKPIEVSAIGMSTEVASPEKVDGAVIRNDLPHAMETKVKKVEKCVSQKTVSAIKLRSLKKCPSTPSIFFIGCAETEENEIVNEFEQEVDEECPSGQELYAKAETFIGNFYKQLKMQREDSWKKIHGLYHKAF